MPARSFAQVRPHGLAQQRTEPPPALFVIGGSPAGAEYSAVGALILKGADDAPLFLCAGTLIAPRLVLTAAHCIDLPSSADVFFTLAADPSQPGRAIAAAQLYLHPAYRISSDSSAVANDLGVVELIAALDEVAPEQIADGSPLQLGADVELVGYGSTSFPPSPERRKNAGRAVIMALGERELTIGATQAGVENCTGDSGGPSFARDASGQRRIVGVVSRALNPATPCQGGSIHTRVDAYRDFVAEVQAAAEERRGSGSGCAIGPLPARPTGVAVPLAVGAWICLLARRSRRTRKVEQKVRDQVPACSGASMRRPS